MAEIFGFEIKRKEKEPASFAPKETDDGAVVIENAGAGYQGIFLDLQGTVKTEAELINKYRDMAQNPELEEAIDNVVNEAIVQEYESKPVELILDDLEQPEKVKSIIIDEFKEILNLLDFNSLSYETFKRWYVDGRLYYHAITDETNPSRGIIELRYIDPRKIRKVREVSRRKKLTTAPLSTTASEYYIYNEKGFSKTTPSIQSSTTPVNGIKIAKDSIIHCTSGLSSQNGDLIYSYLHKAIRPLNQLRIMEDSILIYRVSRAPERRIFYIDVGDLPPKKAEQYVKSQMDRFKNKISYNATTGEVKSGPKVMNMMEDFWFPRRSNGRATEVSAIPGGQNLGQLDDVLYFQKKLYKALNVPVTRLDPEVNFNLGRSTEITRDEVSFSRFITRLRNKFSILFLKILERQLILKRVIEPEEWESFRDVIKFKYAQDNYISELKESEMLKDRLAILADIQDYVGSYYSNSWVRKNILKQSDEDIKEIDEEIKEELDNPQYNPEPPQDMQPPAPPPPAPVTKVIIGGKETAKVSK